MDEARLAQAKALLLKLKQEITKRFPLYGSFLQHLNTRIGTTKTSTACTDGRSIWFNIDYLLGLTEAGAIFLYLHEIGHVSAGHSIRRGNRDHRIWNLAGDYVINLLLFKVLGSIPKGALYNTEYEGLSTEQVYRIIEDKRRSGEAETEEEEQAEDDVQPPPPVNPKPKDEDEDGEDEGDEEDGDEEDEDGEPGEPGEGDEESDEDGEDGESETEDQTDPDENDVTEPGDEPEGEGEGDDSEDLGDGSGNDEVADDSEPIEDGEEKDGVATEEAWQDTAYMAERQAAKAGQGSEWMKGELVRAAESKVNWVNEVIECLAVARDRYNWNRPSRRTARFI